MPARSTPIRVSRRWPPHNADAADLQWGHGRRAIRSPGSQFMQALGHGLFRSSAGKALGRNCDATEEDLTLAPRHRDQASNSVPQSRTR